MKSMKQYFQSQADAGANVMYYVELINNNMDQRLVELTTYEEIKSMHFVGYKGVYPIFTKEL